MIYILAYDRREATAIALRMELHRSQWSFVSAEYDLRGLSRCCVFVSADAMRRQDYLRIREEVERRQSWIWTETR